MGVTKASFQVVGKDEELNDLLNKMDSGILSYCAHSLSDNIGHPSGPEALEGSRLINFVYTAHGVNSTSVRGSISASKLNGGMSDESSLVKTLEKYLFSCSLFSLSKCETVLIKYLEYYGFVHIKL